ncbi:MAG: dihydropteroate synthase [Anaerolineae bacterium]|nr:dihydropteroate synthase [Candidatus Roseilinea sp.]MDW8451141.1 dihydropteroate synthase [Anaerolineae bacterium]
METVISSPTKTVVIGPNRPFVIIGERINPTGRKKLAAEMAAGDFRRVRDDAIAQVAAGAHVLDVNAGIPLADEPALLAEAIRVVQSVTDVPICIDSSVVAALKAGLAVVKGKPLVNSVTGEEERLESVLPMVAEHKAAVIGISNDETGISYDIHERFKVAKKIVERAERYGIPREDVIIDPLAMPAGAVHGAGKLVFDLVRMIREELGCNTVCGASNISFGLPGRPILNAAFISMVIAAGMPCAITNPLEPEIKNAILAANLLMGNDSNCMAWIAAQREAESQRAGDNAARATAAEAARAEREARRAARRAAQTQG